MTDTDPTTIRYRVASYKPTFTDSENGPADSNFLRGDVVINVSKRQRSEPLCPDGDGDVFMERESDSDFYGHIAADQLVVVGSAKDSAPVDYADFQLKYYADAAARLDLSHEFERISLVANALYTLDTETSKEN
jgi:hypothetical protein